MDPALALIFALGIVAGTLGGIAGFGSLIILMPGLVFVFGAREAIPIMGVAAVVGNVSRVAIWWRAVDWRTTFAYSVTAAPAAVAGASTLLVIAGRWIEAGLGMFFISMIGMRRVLSRNQRQLRLGGLALAGAVVGFLTGLLATTGPINAPFFLMAGLKKGAFIGTEAAGSLAVLAAKLTAFRTMDALPSEAVANGLLIGLSLMLGTIIGKKALLHVSVARFENLSDLVLLVTGMTLIATALF
jgi:uncharacterized membrane protein YfcA